MSNAITRGRRAIGQGPVVWLVGLNPAVLDVVRRAGLDKQLGPDRMLFNTRVAIERYQAMRSGTSMPDSTG